MQIHTTISPIEVGFFEMHKQIIIPVIAAVAVILLVILGGALYGYMHILKTLGCRAKPSSKHSDESDLLIHDQKKTDSKRT